MASISSSKKKYKEDLTSASSLMLNVGSNCEDNFNKYNTVWGTTIKSKNGLDRYDVAQACGIDTTDFLSKVSTSKTFSNGKEYQTNDFNATMGYLTQYFQATRQTDNINGGYKGVEIVVGELNNPPSEYKEHYELVLSMYSSLGKIKDLAISPSGSYSTYSSTFTSYSDKFLQDYNTLKIKLK